MGLCIDVKAFLFCNESQLL